MGCGKSSQKAAPAGEGSLPVALGSGPESKVEVQSQDPAQPTVADNTEAKAGETNKSAANGEAVSATEPVKDQEPFEVTFQPGVAGFAALWDIGKVTFAERDSQAERLGVKAGWFIKSINGSAYTEQLYDAAVSSGMAFTAVLQPFQPEPAPEERSAEEPTVTDKPDTLRTDKQEAMGEVAVLPVDQADAAKDKMCSIFGC